MTELEIFAQRLKQARILKKISMDQLVLLIGCIVSKQAISKYESAKMKPTSTILIALATALDVDVEYFFRPFVFNVEQFQVSFRKKSDTKAKDVNALKVQIQDEIERYLEVEELLGKPIECIQCSEGEKLTTKKQMRDLAIELRKEWNLGEDAIGNVQDTLESKGIKVISTEAPEGFDGVSGIVNDKDFIVVLNSAQKHVERRRFTGMHELGHLLYNNRFSENLTPRERENLCNSFASEMLLPTATLEKIFKPGEKISTSELRQLQLVYGISVDAIMHKLNEIGIVSDSKYKTYNIRKRQNKTLRDFAEASYYKENMTNKFETMVYAAAAKDLITTSKAASLLHTSISTVRKHLNVI
ncbi:MAG: XRE family transcriptional regulator [Bacteroidales bacterium]|nr:XRE family transcriptional regulator [Bacteroidales bacterium]MDD6554933.1 XRE family transcriptional regulator [Bacteroidales bacterium]MDD6774609.1 XRE family transcriptional regulator [Bacteroidales bacterium]